MRLIPRKTIHVWGGFGSQLLGVAFAEEQKRLHSRFDFDLVFHTSGITQRHFELPVDVLSSPAKFVYDYVEFEHSPTPFKTAFLSTLNSSLHRSIRAILDATGIVLFERKNDSRNVTRTWTLQIRRTYTNSLISKETVQKLAMLLRLDQALKKDALECVVHLRLGDLLNLTDKTFIGPEKVALQINGICLTNSLCTIFTESPFEAQLLIEELINCKSEYLTVEPIMLLHSAKSSGVFVGTNSKISLWAAVLRALDEIPSNLTFLPTDLIHIVNKITPWARDSITFYG